MRLFIAVLFEDKLKNALIRAENALRNEGVRGNYTKRENLHLTLAFIGEYPDEKKVLEAMRTLSFAPFSLSFGKLGSFGSVWWAGLNDDRALPGLAAKLRAALKDAGIPFDGKPFSPHVTLVRQPDRADLPALELPPERMTVKRISLMSSRRTPAGMVYTEIGSVQARAVSLACK